MNLFSQEIMQQTQALDALIQHYQSSEGAALLEQVSTLADPLLLGMGASLHAGEIGAMRLQDKGINAYAFDAVQFLYYSDLTPRIDQDIVYISQSGSSGEVLPVMDRLQSRRVIGISNDPQSALAQRAALLLPLMVDHEQTVATKTYINTHALLHLISGGAMDDLYSLRDSMANLLAQRDQLAQQWLDVTAGAAHLYFLGHGPHAVTAKQGAMIVSEWAKYPVHYQSIGAFRHGFIEVIENGYTVVLFGAGGRMAESVNRLAAELAANGARVLLVSDGRIHDANADIPAPTDEYLSTVLDTLPVQFFADVFARERNVPPRFRYISKVVRKI